ncbi:MAG: hypothetical protein Q7K16_01280 [Candidatus Azambacteria bacterium]|nr:hypothetical protein [Candidatus Azambacteria bacterium]
MSKGVQELREAVEKEIKNHLIWCSPRCDTFLPQAYREERMIRGHSAASVQKDYDMCHAFR